MSADSMEVVKCLWEAADRRDTQAVLALYDPAVELDVSAFPLVDTTEKVYRGHEGLQRLFREWREVWEDAESELLDVIPSEEQVVTLYRYRGRGRRSGLPVQEEFATLWTVEGGLVTRVKWFVRREDAIAEATGPAE